VTTHQRKTESTWYISRRISSTTYPNQPTYTLKKKRNKKDQLENPEKKTEQNGTRHNNGNNHHNKNNLDHSISKTTWTRSREDETRLYLEMVNKMQIEILNGGETRMLVNFRFKLNHNLNLNLYREIRWNLTPCPFSCVLRQCLNPSSQSHSEKLAISWKGFSLQARKRESNWFSRCSPPT